MASAGLRHLQQILGARTTAGKKDRWNTDPLTTLYFGRGARVAEIRVIHGHLERAHRRLRDKVLNIRLHPADPERDGRNAGFFLSPNSFRLYAGWVPLNPVARAGMIIHELLHEWMIDQKIGDEVVYGERLTQRLAIVTKDEARRNPDNYAVFCQEVWLDAGIETPSGGQKRDEPLVINATNIQNETGAVSDRPVICRTHFDQGWRGVLAAVHGKGSDVLRLIRYQKNGSTLDRVIASELGPRMDGSPTMAMNANDVYVTALHDRDAGRMRLIAWQMDNDRLTRIGDSGDLVGRVYATPAIAWMGGRFFGVAIKGKSGRMKVILMRLEPDGEFKRLGDAETSGPIRNAPAIAHAGPASFLGGLPSRIDPENIYAVTAFCTREERLSFDVWLMDTLTGEVRRQGGHVDHSMTDKPAIAGTAGGLVVTAARDKESGRLRLTYWRVHQPGESLPNPGRPRRLGDSGNDGVRMTNSPDIASIPNGPTPYFVTAVRMADGGRLRVNQWSWRTFRANVDTDLSVRERDSGTVGPVILRSPSIANRDVERQNRFFTASTGPGDTLILNHWVSG
ncbi:MAG: hypothetical protein ACK5PS_00085 [Desulfopila sp.]